MAASGPGWAGCFPESAAELAVAKNLANGTYTVKSNATYVLMAGNVHVDANGGRLKSSRKSAY